ncbi:MAG: hypothetical protein HY717_11395 [Planctomycetes bacterium]|nr:hypothetical protein [Planctomycetota bacterium]
MMNSKSIEQEGLDLSPSVLRRFTGPRAKEIFLLCRPEPQASNDISHQAESACRRLQDLLDLEGGSLKHLVKETVFFRSIREDVAAFQKVHRRIFREASASAHHLPILTVIEQPPLDDRLRLEISAHAVIPLTPEHHFTWNVPGDSPCACEACSQPRARVFFLGGQEHVHTGNIYGSPEGIFKESCSMFYTAEKLLNQLGMSFKDVMRTWIYLRHMERDYGEFNRARSAFFKELGLTLYPASTGINGAPLPPDHQLSLSLYALRSSTPLEVEAMTTPTLNEAWMYGSDFSRGLKVVEANKVALYISGTASVDEAGRTAHAGDFEAQVDRMLLNISALLSESQASFHDLVSGITYLKRPADAPRMRRVFQRWGLEGFPNAKVKAGVCRPDLHCEMECLAALPRVEESGEVEGGRKG